MFSKLIYDAAVAMKEHLNGELNLLTIFIFLKTPRGACTRTLVLLRAQVRIILRMMSEMHSCCVRCKFLLLFAPTE
jgi:hypothetical protein